MNIGTNIILNNGEIYWIKNNNNTHKISVTNKNNFSIIGNNSTIKYEKGTYDNFPYTNFCGHYFLFFDNCQNFSIENLQIDTNGIWYDRKQSYTDWQQYAFNTIDSIRISQCSYVYLNNVKTIHGLTGFSFSKTTYFKVENCSSYETNADGLEIGSYCKEGYIYNHKVEYSDDDSYACSNWVSASEDPDGTLAGPSNIFFSHCYSYNSYGGLICCYGSHNICMKDCIARNLRMFPIRIPRKVPQSIYNIEIENIDCTYYVNTNLTTSDERRRFNITIPSTSTANSTQVDNIKIINSTFSCLDYNLETRDIVRLQFDGFKNLIIFNCFFDNIELYFSNSENITVQNSTLKTFGRISFDNVKYIIWKNNNIYYTEFDINNTGEAAVFLPVGFSSPYSIFSRDNLYFDFSGDKYYHLYTSSSSVSKLKSIIIDYKYLSSTRHVNKNITFINPIIDNDNYYLATEFKEGTLLIKNNTPYMIINNTFVALLSNAPSN